MKGLSNIFQRLKWFSTQFKFLWILPLVFSLKTYYYYKIKINTKLYLNQEHMTSNEWKHPWKRISEIPIKQSFQIPIRNILSYTTIIVNELYVDDFFQVYTTD